MSEAVFEAPHPAKTIAVKAEIKIFFKVFIDCFIKNLKFGVKI
jgi:hypothetical protein